MDAKKLGKKIKIARIEKDMSQEQLAEAIQIKQKSISRYETGSAIPPLEAMQKMSIVLNKSFEYFLAE